MCVRVCGEDALICTVEFIQLLLVNNRCVLMLTLTPFWYVCSWVYKCMFLLNICFVYLHMHACINTQLLYKYNYHVYILANKSQYDPISHLIVSSFAHLTQ